MPPAAPSARGGQSVSGRADDGAADDRVEGFLTVGQVGAGLQTAVEDGDVEYEGELSEEGVGAAVQRVLAR